jgi:hypothetical protein
MSVKNGIVQIATDLKLATASAAMTTGTGTATFLDYIPTDVGKLATVIGIILSSVLIYTHIRKYNLEKKTHTLDQQIKLQQIELNKITLANNS